MESAMAAPCAWDGVYISTRSRPSTRREKEERVHDLDCGRGIGAVLRAVKIPLQPGFGGPESQTWRTSRTSTHSSHPSTPTCILVFDDREHLWSTWTTWANTGHLSHKGAAPTDRSSWGFATWTAPKRTSERAGERTSTLTWSGLVADVLLYVRPGCIWV